MPRLMLPLTLCLGALALPATAGEVRKCVDAAGAVTYQQDACGQGQQEGGRWNYDESLALPLGPPVADPGAAATATASPPARSGADMSRGFRSLAPTDRAELRPSNLLECIGADGSYYLRAERCRTRTEATPFAAVDPKTGQTIAVLGPPREVVDPGRPLIRSEACQLARRHLQRMRDDMSRSIDRLREVESQIAENCDD